jgi:hypothetical protein
MKAEVVMETGSSKTSSVEQRLEQYAKRLREEAESVPPGTDRDRLIRRARHAETAARLSLSAAS